MPTNRKSQVFLFLSGIFITNALLAEMIGVKIFSFERSLGFEPLGFPIIENFKFNLDLSAGVVIWPVVFIISDIINEYFGKEAVKRITFIAIGLIAYAFVIVFFVTRLTPSDFWLAANNTDPAGNPFNINYAFKTLYTQSLNIIFASLTAFAIGQVLDAYIFDYIRKLTKERYLWIRATFSTVASQLIDSFLILFLAFYFLGNWSANQVLAVGLVQYTYKMAVTFALIPALNLIHYLIDRYLGIENGLK